MKKRTLSLALLLLMSLSAHAEPFGTTFAVGISRASTSQLQESDALAGKSSTARLGFSKDVSIGQNINLDKYMPLFKHVAFGGHIGFSTLSEARSGITTIANIYKFSPQIKPYHQLTKSIALCGFAGAGLSVVEQKELTRDNSSNVMSMQPNLRIGTGIQIKRIELRIENNGMLLDNETAFHWTEFNIAYLF